MNITTIFKLFLGLIIIPCFIFFFAFNPQPVQAQDSGYQGQAARYSEDELAQMLAPIALYPDALLSQILMASTYPIEVIEADRWLRENRGLTGDILDDELVNKEWDPSVKAICHFPSNLALMSERIAETTSLGNAFLAQETEVMGMIQKLRSGAYEQGNLKTTTEQKVIVEKETIIIKPTNPRALYAPYYDPCYIYGPGWWSPGYAPYYWVPAGVSIGFGISYWPDVYYGTSLINWSCFDWNRRYVYIDLHKRPRFVRHDRWITTSGRWRHTPRHRMVFFYRDMDTARKYGHSFRRPMFFRHDVGRVPSYHRLERKQPRKIETRTNRYHQKQQRVERKIKNREEISHKKQKRQNVNMEKRIEPQKKQRIKQKYNRLKKRQGA